jgi:hypothetical protein
MYKYIYLKDKIKIIVKTFIKIYCCFLTNFSCRISAPLIKRPYHRITGTFVFYLFEFF